MTAENAGLVIVGSGRHSGIRGGRQVVQESRCRVEILGHDGRWTDIGEFTESFAYALVVSYGLNLGPRIPGTRRVVPLTQRTKEPRTFVASGAR